MARTAERAADDVMAFLRAQDGKDFLRFITCGSVDDGKSTLIGRLLYDSQLILEDQMAALKRDSQTYGTTGEDMDFALLVDGLAAEREQGITIDVAYRFFATARRKFIVADTPGHEEYTRNMATGASTAELAVILVDARKGLLTQTQRHAYIVALMGIRDVVLAVNKMDLVGFDQKIFEVIASEFGAFAGQLGIERVTSIPLSARFGDNVVARSIRLPWYQGPALLPILDMAQPERKGAKGPFRMPVQWVNRPNLDFRGYAGSIRGGALRAGDSVMVQPSGRSSRVTRIVTKDGDLDAAPAGSAVTLVLADEIDISRGDVLCAAEAPCSVADQFAAHLVWMAATPLLPGRNYLFQIGTALVGGQITELKHKVNVNTLEHLAGKVLELNEVGFCNLAFDRAISFDPYDDNRDLGGFIVIDRLTNATLGAGMIRFALRRASNISWQKMEVDKRARASLKGQKPCVIWFTGLSGAGKSTISDLVEQRLHVLGRHTYTLDGDNIRHGLNKDLGFTDADRVENIRRVGEVARLFADAGLIVLCSFISPFRSERRMARALMSEGEFLEIFVNAPLDVCAARDPKGLYAKARAGRIRNFTGVDSPYEVPEAAELVLDTSRANADHCAEQVIDLLRHRGLI
jgi:bifunctional enzyme CysN/CysC